MATLPSGNALPHEHRGIAESFGDDADRYDRARPGYPPALVEAALPPGTGHHVLDVGIGTGLSARGFRAAGCHVLGVEVDERMAARARAHGFEVEVAAFERWDDRGRRFDAVVSGQTWHWIDPDAGAATAARVLRPGGRLALFWNAGDPPPEVAAGFAEVYREVQPGLPFTPCTTTAVDGFARILTTAGDPLRRTGRFDEPQQWRATWTAEISREQWLDQVPTAGGHSRIPADRLRALLAGLGEVIDDHGGSFLMTYTTIMINATRNPSGV
jgi:SAM-dependent methyltransferase